MHGFYRIAAAVPKLKVADIDFNVTEIGKLIDKACQHHVGVVVFPELSICGYTCNDLFFQDILLERALAGLQTLSEQSREKNIIVVVGAPIRVDNHLYNCAVVIQGGRIRGVVPKSYLPNYREFYEKRWFMPGAHLDDSTIDLLGSTVPFGIRYIFEVNAELSFGIELCEDLWSVIPPSSFQAIAGATLSLNLSASNELVAKADYRRTLVRQQSARCISGYVYCSSGVGESTTDTIYSGHAMIAENGHMLRENERFDRKSSMIQADIDCQRLLYERLTEGTFKDSYLPHATTFHKIALDAVPPIPELNRDYDPHPFVPSGPEKRTQRCDEIIHIQAAGLTKRFEHTGSAKAVIGISGGLDSTLALLITVQAFKLLKKKPSQIVAVTMPGFGTTDRTYQNAVKLCNELNVDLREISIKEACLLHFADIGHDPSDHDVTYENVQARERTQVLMNIANRERGLVIGTGDLSEIALGWSTYNGDHMSMYAVNCGVPKTLIKYLIQWVADHSDSHLQALLLDIIDTPISPELLPNHEGAAINQKTEELIGPYELHDFFLYHFVKYGASPEKIVMLTSIAFKSKYDTKTIRKFLKTFLSRFFAQQFKRSCIPDGPKVGTISLSPRADWRMPSDASSREWLADLDR